MFYRFHYFFPIVVMILIAGCSGGSSPTAPIAPDDSSLSVISHDKPFGVGVVDYFVDGSPASGAGTMGVFQLEIDPVNVTADLSSIRKTALPDVLEVVDITNFLSLAPCTDCVKIKSVSLDENDNIVLSIGIKHPFPEGDPFKPITGRNRGDLHVFNIEGIVISNADGIPFPGTGEIIADFTLLNADGYTGYLDDVIDNIFPTDATIHPYKLHFDDYSQGNFDPANAMGFESVTIPHPSGNLVMPMGSDYDYTDYIFTGLSESVDFIFAVGCTYAVSSAIKAMRFSPEYRVPQHCKKAASEVWIEIGENNLADSDPTSSAEIVIKILDINHGVPVGDNLDEMLADSSVSEITVEIPGVLETPIVETSLDLIGDGRDPENPLTYEMTINNAASAVEGEYRGLVKVRDSYPPGLNESPLLSGMDGIERVDPLLNPLEGLFEINEFATYAAFTIEVASIPDYPEACFDFEPDSVRLEIDAAIEFDGSCSHDPGGFNIVQWEWMWDWDGDPASFEPDDITTEPTISHEFTSAGDFLVALRVTNDAPSPRTSEIFSDTVTVNGWILPPVKLTSDNVLYSDLWWSTDIRIRTTTDGYAHAIVSSTYTGFFNQVDYYLLDTSGVVSTDEIWFGHIRDIGLEVTDDDHLYAFIMNHEGIFYRRNTGTGWEDEVLCMEGRSGYTRDHADYAINPDGHILVLMSEYGSCPTPADISISIDEGSGFSPKQLVTEVDRWRLCSNGGGSGYGITVAAIADSTGTFHLAWDGIPAFGSTNREIWYAYHDGSISDIQLIASTAAQEFFPLLRLDADDNLWCGYRDFWYGNFMTVKPAGSTSFEPAFRIDPTPAHNFSFDINHDTGDIMYMNYQLDSAIGERHIWCKLFNVDDSPSEILDTFKWRLDESVDERHWWPNVTYGKDGHWYAIWDDQRNMSAPSARGELFYAVYW